MFRYIHKHMSAFVCTCASGFFIVQQLSVRHGHDQDNPFSIYNRSFHTGRQADRQAVSKLVTARPINPCNLYIYNNCCVDVDVDSVLNKNRHNRERSNETNKGNAPSWLSIRVVLLLVVVLVLGVGVGVVRGPHCVIGYVEISMFSRRL